MEERGLAVSDSLFFGDDIERIRTPRGYEHVPKWQMDEYKRQAKDTVNKAYQRDAFLERQRKYVEETTSAARKALLELKPTSGQAEQKMQEMSALLKENKQLMLE